MSLFLLSLAIAWLVACFWAYQGVFFFLARTGPPPLQLEVPPPRPPVEVLPSVTVLVPCYEEATLIADKVQNTLALEYPAEKLRVVFCDGGSRDGTVEALERLTAGRPEVTVLRSPQRGKTQQLIYALAQVASELVVQTDCDAVLPADALYAFAHAFALEPRAGVVGAWVEPRTSLAEEAAFWRDQNALRRVETRGGVASVVIAACYAYRRAALSELPADVIADDVHVAFRCQMNGYSTHYLDSPRVFEVRAAEDMGAIWRHKFRKAHANLRELARFTGQFRAAPLRWRVVFSAKVFQSWVAPLTLPVGLALVAYAWWLSPLAMAITFVSLALTTLAFSRQLVAASERGAGRLSSGLLLQVKMFAVTLMLLSAAAMAYPWTHHTSSFERLPPRA